MTQLLTKIIADFSTTLTTKTAVGATTATLTSGLDGDAIQLPTGTYGFTIDRNNANKEYFTATLTGANLTDIKTVTRGTGVGTSGLVRTHRKGAEVIISDWVAMKRMLDILDGTTSLDASTPLGYDGTATISTANQLATKAYADALAIAGSPDATTTTKGITKMSVAPASATSPIAVGDNDPRVPTQDENDALVGTSGTPSSTNKYVTDADTRFIQSYYFGDGSDGTVTFDGSTTILGMVPSSSIYTMTRDIHCVNITVNTGVTIKPSGYKIFATGIFTMSGTATISRVGNNGADGGVGSTGVNGAGGAGGAALAAGTLDGSVAGGTGATSLQSGGAAQAGVGTPPGTAVSNSIGSNGVAGGGSNGTGGGSTAGAGGIATASITRLTKGWNIQSLLDVTTSGSPTRFTNSAASTGGASGASDAVAGHNGGGGGGAGSAGGVIAIYAYSIVIGASSVISVVGGNGGNGGTGQNGTGGGGGGGNGGIVVLVYYSLSNLGTISLTGGTAGTSGGTAATNGAIGLLKQFSIV